MHWDIIAGIAAIVALVLALPSTWTALRDALSQSQKARQEILNALPKPTFRPMQVVGFGSEEEEIEYVLANSLDIASLNAGLSMPTKDIQKAVEDLIKAHKIEVYVSEGMIAEGPMKGKKALVPYFFKGGMSPSLRPSPEKLQMAINAIHSET